MEVTHFLPQTHNLTSNIYGGPNKHRPQIIDVQVPQDSSKMPDEWRQPLSGDGKVSIENAKIFA